MAYVPNSSLASYLTVTEFLRRCDYNTVGQLVSDNGQPVDPISLQTNVNLLTVLEGASGELEAACLSAKRYQPEDLAGLVGVSAVYRDDVITGLAIPRLPGRRPQPLEQWKHWIERADKALAALGDGHMIFGFVEVQEAGLIDVQKDTPQDVQNRYLTTVQARRYYGTRGNQIRPGYGWNDGCGGCC